MGRHRVHMRGGRHELALAVARLEAVEFERWLGDKHRTRNRRFGLFVALSLALHALFFSIERDPPKLSDPASSAPMNVRIVPGPEIVAELPAQAPIAKPPPAPPRPRAPVVPKPDAPPPIVADSSKTTVPAPVPEPTPAPPAPPAPAVDMLAMIEAKREARRRAGEASGRAPPKVDPAAAAINRNLASLRDRGDGVGGVFQILRKGVRTAEFAFNGWKPEANRSWREVIEVDAGPGGDVERAIVRRMIELIRTHYKGDFQWESHRLDRVVTLSARPQDHDGLEDFLVREFFGTPVIGRSR
jgi:outer membrane biosynthesis protein TonB